MLECWKNGGMKGSRCTNTTRIGSRPRTLSSDKLGQLSYSLLHSREGLLNFGFTLGVFSFLFLLPF